MNLQPINSHCPWSGKPVAADSTIQYRGKIVAFCNPGCRDKFEAAMNMFDKAIEQSREPILEPTEVPEYQPRAVCFDQVLSFNDIRLKLYHITEMPGEPIETSIAEKAVAFVRDHLPGKIQNAGGDHGLGYVVLHRGMTDHWLLMHWWGGGDICLASLARLKGGQTEFGTAEGTNVQACVWEHVVINHERDAWVRTMMTSAPNADAYLEDCLANGSY